MARRKTKKKAVVTTTVDDSQFNKPIIQGKIVSNYYGGEWIDRLYSTTWYLCFQEIFFYSQGVT